MKSIDGDRNFDDLVERFERKVYGGLKGEIRLAVLWRDLEIVLQQLSVNARPLRILDIGGGLGQLSMRLAQLGHQVCLNDVSANMLKRAEDLAVEQTVAENMTYLQGPMQAIDSRHYAQYDLVLCHALLEWLENPRQALTVLKQFLRKDGVLSLSAYNEASIVYRNLLGGNFKFVERYKNHQADPQSLTPKNPINIVTLQSWLAEEGLDADSVTGLRVFHDYVFELRGGHQDPSAVIAMELTHSQLEPYKWMGRYIHFICRAES